MNLFEKSEWPENKPIGGIRMSETKELTTVGEKSFPHRLQISSLNSNNLPVVRADFSVGFEQIGRVIRATVDLAAATVPWPRRPCIAQYLMTELPEFSADLIGEQDDNPKETTEPTPSATNSRNGDIEQSQAVVGKDSAGQVSPEDRQDTDNIAFGEDTHRLATERWDEFRPVLMAPSPADRAAVSSLFEIALIMIESKDMFRIKPQQRTARAQAIRVSRRRPRTSRS